MSFKFNRAPIAGFTLCSNMHDDQDCSYQLNQNVKTETYKLMYVPEIFAIIDNDCTIVYVNLSQIKGLYLLSAYFSNKLLP